jgi:hypothetical protein
MFSKHKCTLHFCGFFISAVATLLFGTAPSIANDKLLGTPGISTIEGAGGGGFVPWAQLGGYADSHHISLAGFCSRANVDDYRLTTCGVRGDFYDRVEVSYTEQEFDIDALNTTIRHDIFGAKVRLFGDVVYSDMPQVSVGIQSKSLRDNEIANLLGARDDSGTDVYIAMSKVHLNALWNRNIFWNLTMRNSDANQTGLLGFGSQNGSREWLAEASAAVFLNRNVAIGAEYRQKPNNLALREDDWKNLFIAYFVNKNVNVTLAYLDLGVVAGAEDQTGYWLTVTGYW